MPHPLSQQSLLNGRWRRLQLRKEIQLKTSASAPMQQCLPVLKISLFLTANILVALFLSTNAWASPEECEFSCEAESYPKVAYLLNPSTFEIPPPTHDYSYPIFGRTIVGPTLSASSAVDSSLLSNHFHSAEQGITVEWEIGVLRAPISRYSVFSKAASPSEQANSFHALEPPDVLIAAPQNLNPGLYVPLFDAEEYNEDPLDLDDSELSIEENLEDAEEDTSKSGLFNYLSDFSVSDLDLDYQQNFDNFGGFEYGLQPTLSFENSRGDRLGLTTGVEIFDQVTTLQVTNVPLEIGWHRKIGQSSIDISAGVDFFDRLSMAPRLSAGGSTPLFKGVTLSGVIEYGPYKFNAQTLENEIRALRLGPNIFWQIAPNTTLFSLMRVGTYNDGNTEQQSFSRLEQRVGPFGVAANLFNWVYRGNKEMSSGYFSPQDFLVYSGEIFWADTLFNRLDCRVSASLGRQRLGGSWTSGYSYGGECAIPITQSISVDLQYAFSNVRDQMTGESAFNSSALTGGLRVDF